jgi:hypothetical protein
MLKMAQKVYKVACKKFIKSKTGKSSNFTDKYFERNIQSLGF